MNYILEGNVDFNINLMKELDITNNKSNICLISKKPLKEDFIKLTCNHTFNYEEIFKEVERQKKTNRYETTIIKKKEIKCPYCRKIQKGILPYSNIYSIKKLNINWPPKYAIKTNNCKAIYKSGKKKGMICKRKCFGNYCSYHKPFKKKINNNNNE